MSEENNNDAEEIKEIVSGEEFQKLFEQLSKIVDIEKMAELFEKGSFSELMTYLTEAIVKAIQTKEGLGDLSEFIQGSLKNLGKFIGPLFDKELHRELTGMFQEALKIDEAKFFDIYLQYNQSYQAKYPLHRLTASLLIHRKFKPITSELVKEAPMGKMFEQFPSIFMEMIENKQEDEFRLYFFDWILKFGYLIEAYVKDILITQLKIGCLLNGEEYSNIESRNRMIGQLLHTLEADQALAKYRNAIFHTTFIIDYKTNLDERKIIFYDFGVERELGIIEFINMFFSLIQLVKTYWITITASVPLEQRPGQKEIFDMLEDFKKALK